LIKQECQHIQERLASIWKRLLGLERLTHDQNFFAMGGHSILAIDLLSEIEEVFAVKLNMKDIAEAPSVHDLSQIILTYKKNVALASQNLDFSNGYYPLTTNQKQVWGLNVLYPESITYNISTAIKINRKLDINLLTKTINTIVERHESLRTRFKIHNGVPHQEVIPEYKYHFEFIDIKQEQLKEVLQEEMKHLFNLEEAPLMKINFYRLSEEEVVFYFLVHHIIWDGLSNTFFFHEFISIYRSLENGENISVPEVRLAYKEHAVKEIEYLKSEDFFEQKRSWENIFKGKLPVLNLPTDYPRSPRINNQSETIYFELNAEMLEKLEVYAQTKYLSLYNIFFAVYYVLLARISGENDFIVGTPVHGRNNRDVRKTLGYFINTLPVRTTLDPMKSFKDNLGIFLESLKHAFYNQNVPLDVLLKNSTIENDPSRTPLFQTLFIYLDVTKELDVFKSESLEQIKLERYSVHTEIDFYLYKSRDKVEGVIEFRKDLYSSCTMKKMGEDFINILDMVLQDELQTLNEMGVKSVVAKNEMIEMDMRPYDDFSNERPFYKAFENMAELYPDKEAIKTSKGRLSYDELNKKSDLVAAKLLSQGIKIGDLVGVSTNRNEKLVIALLGVLKAGATYVPLDPKFPDERLHYMMERSGAKILLSEKSLISRFPQYANHLLIEDVLNAKSPKIFTSVDVGLQSSCYVLFTSGSTGKPKGVEVSHENVLNFLKSMSKKPGLTNTDCLLSVTTFSFDISVLEIFLPLMEGATVYLANEEQVIDGDELVRIIKQEKITCMQATPSSWRLLLAAGWEGNSELKILCGGESMPKDLAYKLLALSKEVWNMYGPTETTVWSTVKQLSFDDKKILIGSAIDNTCLYILNEKGESCPVGVEGHLFIGGLGVAKGYIQDLEQTYKRFVKNPFRFNELMYDTGDMARFESSGEVECLGRSDDQVKIRGFRIELGEIEEVALRQEFVHECAVKVHGNSIFVYLTLKPKTTYNEEALKKVFRENLPGYMIPQKILILDYLPKTLNGKIDKKALTEKACLNATFIKETVSLEHTATMSEITAIWKTILQAESVDVDENFFNLGGHSISAVEIFGIVNDKFNLNLPLSVIFEAATIRSLSDVIDSTVKKNSYELSQLKCVVAIKPGKKNLEPIFCFHGVGGNVLNYYPLGTHAGERAFYGVQSVGVNGEDQIVETIPSMAKIYIQEIKKVQPKGPYILSGGSMGGMVALEVAAQLKSEGEEIKSLVMFDTVGPNLDFKTYGNVKVGFITRTKSSLSLRYFKTINFMKTQFYTIRKVSIPHSLRYFSIEDKNFAALRSYTPTLYEGSIVLIRAPRTAKGWYADPYLGWRKVINGKIETIEIKGDHHKFIEGPEMSEAFKKVIKRL
jgi:amino acid adenylation domain-containing protein